MKILRVAPYFTLVLIAACTPEIRIVISGDSSNCELRFKNPMLLRGDPVIEEVVVYSGRPGGIPPLCELKAIQDARALVTWRYGTIPIGFSLPRCAPLERGQTYTINVSGVGVGATRFTVGRDGKIEPLGRRWW